MEVDSVTQTFDHSRYTVAVSLPDAERDAPSGNTSEANERRIEWTR